jgi:hypothetical protein
MNHFSALFRIILLPAVMSIVAGCAGDLRKAEQEIRTVSGRFVKDRRTEIFTVEPFRLKKDTIILKGETTLPQAKETLIIALNEQTYKS